MCMIDMHTREKRDEKLLEAKKKSADRLFALQVIWRSCYEASSRKNERAQK